MTSPYMCTCMQMHQTATSLLLARQSSRAMLLYMLVSMRACVRACVVCACVKTKARLRGRIIKLKQNSKERIKLLDVTYTFTFQSTYVWWAIVVTTRLASPETYGNTHNCWRTSRINGNKVCKIITKIFLKRIRNIAHTVLTQLEANRAQFFYGHRAKQIERGHLFILQYAIVFS